MGRRKSFRATIYEEPICGTQRKGNNFSNYSWFPFQIHHKSQPPEYLSSVRLLMSLPPTKTLSNSLMGPSNLDVETIIMVDTSPELKVTADLSTPRHKILKRLSVNTMFFLFVIKTWHYPHWSFRHSNLPGLKSTWQHLTPPFSNTERLVGAEHSHTHTADRPTANTHSTECQVAVSAMKTHEAKSNEEQD